MTSPLNGQFSVAAITGEYGDPTPALPATNGSTHQQSGTDNAFTSWAKIDYLCDRALAKSDGDSPFAERDKVDFVLTRQL